MKKILMLVSVLFIGLIAYSQNIKKASGSLSILKDINTISVSFTYENMKVGKMTEEKYVQEKIDAYNKKKDGWGDEWHKAWLADREDRYEPKFMELFSKYLGEKDIEAIFLGNGDVKLIVNVDFIEPGFNVGVVRKSASVDFTCRLVDKEDGSEIAKITIEDSSANNWAGNDYDVGFRVQESFAKGGRELAKFIIKNAK